MPHVAFEWDKKKNQTNRRKHGVSFDEAESIFSDENALIIHDPATPTMKIVLSSWDSASSSGCWLSAIATDHQMKSSESFQHVRQTRAKSNSTGKGGSDEKEL